MKMMFGQNYLNFIVYTVLKKKFCKKKLQQWYKEMMNLHLNCCCYVDFSLVLSLIASSVTIADLGDIQVNTSLVWIVEKLWWKEGDFRNIGENAKT